MEIYINTAKQPPSVAADANGLQLTTSFEFKRGTTVPLTVYLPADAAAGVARLRYGAKLKGRYDDVLVVSAETTVAGTETARGVPFELKPTFDAATIDTALSANGVNTDDIESAAFISEFAWENAAGEVTATRTISTKIVNNVIRKGDGTESDLPAAQYTAVMAVKISWADYCALPTKSPDVIYFIPDAPEHALSKEEAAETFAQLREEIEENRGAIIAHGEQLEALAGLAADSETALGQVAASVPLLETVPAAGTSNADAYGYIGTLRDLGAFGGAVDVRQLTVYRRTEGTQTNGSVALWARILKNVDGAWTVAAQSTHSIAWNDYSFGLPFTMAPVAGVTPPSADEKIAIVFVNSATAAAGASNGTVSFRTVDGSGGVTTALGADANTASSNSTWRPRTKLRFAALPGAEECATKGDIEDLKTGNTYLLQRISALETRVAALETPATTE